VLCLDLHGRYPAHLRPGRPSVSQGAATQQRAYTVTTEAEKMGGNASADEGRYGILREHKSADMQHSSVFNRASDIKNAVVK
jgi:hypothetical protein